MMISKTKYKLDNEVIISLFNKAGFSDVSEIAELGDGEFNAVYSALADGKKCVLKIAPSENAPILSYEKNMMHSEVFWYEKMREQTSIRVPDVYFFDFTKDTVPVNWFIMEKLNGEPLNKMKLSAEEKKLTEIKIAEMTAELHKVKNDEFGYIQRNELYDNWYIAIRKCVEVLIGECEKKGKKSSRGKKTLAFIDKYTDILKKAPCCMVNFDIWLPNIMCKRENGELKLAWIDPERSYWGDPMVDFVCLKTLVPLNKKSYMLDAYNSVTDIKVTATKDEKIRYAIAEAYLGLIMETEKYYRYTPSHFGWWRNVFASSAYYISAFSVLKK